MIWSNSKDKEGVPQFYEVFHVSPLSTKGSKDMPENYRPVSLTSHIVTNYERMLRKKMVSHLERKKINATSSMDSGQV